MGRKPMPMTPMPSEWLLDIFNPRPTVRRPAPYVFEVPTPPMPWMLRYGNYCLAGTLILGGIAIYFAR